MGHLRVILCHIYLMINTDNNPFFDQSYCSWQTKPLKNSAFHFLKRHLHWPLKVMTQGRSDVTCNVVSSYITPPGHQQIVHISMGATVVLIRLLTQCTWKIKSLALILRKKKIPTAIMSYVVPCCSRKYTISHSGEY